MIFQFFLTLKQVIVNIQTKHTVSYFIVLTFWLFFVYTIHVFYTPHYCNFNIKHL